MSRREALAQLRALERWVEEAASVHPRPQVLEAPFERDVDGILELAHGDPALMARVEARLSALRVRLFPSTPGA